MNDNIPERISLYNIIAELCSYLESVGKSHFILYKSLSDKELRRIDDRIVNDTYLSLSEKGKYLPVFEPDLSPEYIDKLHTFKEKICAENDKNAVIRFLQALDETVSVLLYDEREILEGNRVSSEINTNRASTGISLFPKMNCVWSRKNRQTFSYKRIDSYLRYLLVVQDIPGIEAEHVFIKKDNFPYSIKPKSLMLQLLLSAQKPILI